MYVVEFQLPDDQIEQQACETRSAAVQFILWVREQHGWAFGEGPSGEVIDP
jgi:hypothetical protein